MDRRIKLVIGLALIWTFSLALSPAQLHRSGPGDVTDPRASEMFPGGARQKVVSGGGGCTTTGPDLFVELCEAAYGAAWALAGADNWSVVNVARGACSANHWSHSTMTAGRYLTTDFNNSNPTYVDFWFKFTGGPDDNGEYITFCSLGTDDPYRCLDLQLYNNSGTLEIRPYYYDGGNVTGTAYTPAVASTWYHIGMMYDSTAKTMAFYCATTQSLGAAVYTKNGMTTTRTPGKVVIGAWSGSGTFNGTLEYDSIGIDDDSMTAVEY